MNIDAYQASTANTAIYPNAGEGSAQALAYVALGLCGEAGEVAEKIKKLLRDGNFNQEDVLKELGDVEWYWVRMCEELGVMASDILIKNQQKLADRKFRGVISGSGDNR